MTDFVADATFELEDLLRSPNPLAAHYRRFEVADRLLLTGHSHQAWPDCSEQGQAQAWRDAAELVDRKWERAFAKADRIRAGWRRLLDDPDGEIALGANTHELVVRFGHSMSASLQCPAPPPCPSPYWTARLSTYRLSTLFRSVQWT